MLSDALTEMRDRLLPLVPASEAKGLFLTFRAFEMEARSMEHRLLYLTGRPHSPLDGRLVSSPIIDIRKDATSA